MTNACRWLASVLGLVLFVSQAFASPAVPWTSVGSAGIVDETSLKSFVFTGACASLRPVPVAGAPDSLELRYDVTSTFDNWPEPTDPGWNVFEMGYSAPTGSQILARLILVQPCTGKERTICQVKIDPARQCVTCRFDPALINFDKALYYIDVEDHAPRFASGSTRLHAATQAVVGATPGAWTPPARSSAPPRLPRRRTVSVATQCRCDPCECTMEIVHVAHDQIVERDDDVALAQTSPRPPGSAPRHARPSVRAPRRSRARARAAVGASRSVRRRRDTSGECVPSE